MTAEGKVNQRPEIPLAPTGKSSLPARPFHARFRGTLRDRHETLGVECGGRSGARDEAHCCERRSRVVL